MIGRMAVAAFILLIGLAFAGAMKTLWADSMMTIVRDTTGATDFEATIFGFVPIAILIAVFGTAILLVLKEPTDGRGGF